MQRSPPPAEDQAYRELIRRKEVKHKEFQVRRHEGEAKLRYVPRVSGDGVVDIAPMSARDQQKEPPFDAAALATIAMGPNAKHRALAPTKSQRMEEQKRPLKLRRAGTMQVSGCAGTMFSTLDEFRRDLVNWLPANAARVIQRKVGIGVSTNFQ